MLTISSKASIGALLMAMLPVASCFSPAQSPMIRMESGALSGVRESGPNEVYKGVPFAAPPVVSCAGAPRFLPNPGRVRATP